MRLLITGGAGFVGHRLTQALGSQNKYQIIVADAAIPREKVAGVAYLQLDLRDSNQTKQAFVGVDICVNLAALIGPVGYMAAKPATILKSNALILSSTFQAAAHHKLKWMIYSSSSMVYQQSTSWPHQESDLDTTPPPKNIYGFSKLLGEYFCRAYRQEFDLNYTIVRFFNIYGPGESHYGPEPGFAHVIPDLTRRIISGQYPLEIIGDGSQTRAFIHVADAITALVAILDHQDKTQNQDFNIGTTDEITILDLAKKIWQLSGESRAFKTKTLPEFAHTTQRRVPDNTKLTQSTGWQSKIDLDTGLRQVIKDLKAKS